MTPEHSPNLNLQASRLAEILNLFTHKRVVVVGTTCTGKSTLQERIPGAQDMDKLIFPLLTPQEQAYVCQTPWTPEIGEFMTCVTKQRVQVTPGQPVFGTVVLEADIIVHLLISDETLQERTTRRGVSFENAQNMQAHIQQAIVESQVPVVHFCLD